MRNTWVTQSGQPATSRAARRVVPQTLPSRCSRLSTRHASSRHPGQASGPFQTNWGARAGIQRQVFERLLWTLGSRPRVTILVYGPVRRIREQKGEAIPSDVDRTAVDRARGFLHRFAPRGMRRSEEHTSELQSIMRISYAVF